MDNTKRLMFDVNQAQQTIGAYGWFRKNINRDGVNFSKTIDIVL